MAEEGGRENQNTHRNCVKLHHRSLLLLIGDKSRDQIVNLHYMLSKAKKKKKRFSVPDPATRSNEN